MHYDVVDAACIKDFFVYLKFEDGTEGVMNFESIVGQGEVFAPLADKDFFCRMVVDARAGTIVWPNHADFSPQMLYDAIKRTPQGVATYEF